MKKLFFLSILLLLSVSVVAQYSTVAVNPKIISTAIQPTDDCYSVCKRDCIAQKMSDADCAKMCDSRCTQKPLARPILTRPQIIEPAQEDCPAMCRRIASLSLTSANVAGFNAEMFVQCMRDRCKEDCPSACRKMYGAQAMDCIQKFCQPTEAPCEQGCDKEYKTCLETAVGLNPESIRTGCEGRHQKCLQDKCAPKTCEQRCDEKRKMCMETTVGFSLENIRQVCDSKHQQCVQDECGKPEECPPSGTCESRCGYTYHECVKSGRDQTACRNIVGECLDKCAGLAPPQACPDRCRLIEKECLSSGVDPESCRMKVKDCVTQCYPQPLPPQQCEDRCVQIEKKCEMVDDEGACIMEVRRCRNLCAQGSQVSTGQIAERDFEGTGGVDIGGRLPSPKDIAGLNPQPEPPSWWKRVFGFFGG